MALTVYTSFLKKLGDNDIDFVADTIKIILMTNAGYTFSAAHDFRDDLAGEVTGTGYSSGGLSLANKSSSAANPCVLTADDIVVSQSGGGFTAWRKYALAKITGGASSTDPLLFYGATAADAGNVAGALTIDIPSSFITISG